MLGGTGGDADLTAYNDGGAPGSLTAGDTFKLYMAGDYKSAGNIGSRIGNAVAVGASGTKPRFFLQNQILRIPVSDTGSYGVAEDYILVHVQTVDNDQADVASKECVQINGTCIKAAGSGKTELTSFEDATSACLVIDPIFIDLLEILIPVSPLIFFMFIRSVYAASLSFKAGNKDIPPDRKSVV